MKIKEVQKTENKSKILTVRTTPNIYKWIRENNLSVTKVFNKAIEDLLNKRRKI